MTKIDPMTRNGIVHRIARALCDIENGKGTWNSPTLFEGARSIFETRARLVIEALDNKLVSRLAAAERDRDEHCAASARYLVELTEANARITAIEGALRSVRVFVSSEKDGRNAMFLALDREDDGGGYLTEAETALAIIDRALDLDATKGDDSTPEPACDRSPV